MQKSSDQGLKWQVDRTRAVHITDLKHPRLIISYMSVDVCSFSDDSFRSFLYGLTTDLRKMFYCTMYMPPRHDCCIALWQMHSVPPMSLSLVELEGVVSVHIWTIFLAVPRIVFYIAVYVYQQNVSYISDHIHNKQQYSQLLSLPLSRNPLY